MKCRIAVATVTAALTAITAVPGIASASQVTRSEDARAKSTDATKSTGSSRAPATHGGPLGEVPGAAALADVGPANVAQFEHEPFQGLSADAATHVIGSIDPDQLPPVGMGLVYLPQGGGAPDASAFPSPSALSGGYGCAISCIEEGLAYPRGFGAELVVGTSVPTRLLAIVVEITPGYPHVDTTNIYSWNTGHSWVLDDLDPGMSYGVTVIATDGDGNQDIAYGEFTTLSTRDVSVDVGGIVITGPEIDATTSLWLGIEDEDLRDVTPGQGGVPTFEDVGRFSDFGILVIRDYEPILGPLFGECPEAAAGVNGPYEWPDQGHHEGACRYWNTARLQGLDLDVSPAGATRWDSVSFTAQLRTPDGSGDSVPPGFGDGWWMDVVATATFHVTYS
ncbi:MAG: hypothetical protein ACR2OH_14830 [Microthrixaceae bacterium]